MRGRVRGVAVVLVAVGLSGAGCGVPIPTGPPDGAGSGGPSADAAADDVDRLVPDDDRVGVLVDALREVAGRVGEVRALLDTAAVDPTSDAGATALQLLVGPTDDDAPTLLPATPPDRAGAGSDDLVTALVTLAGDTGGEPGRVVLELARDPMLGDLGAWQRDPVGILTLLGGIADDASDADGLDAALTAQPGELTRALGYTLVAARSDDAALAAHAARQGAGRLGVVRIAVDLAVERLTAAADGTGDEGDTGDRGDG